MGLKVFDAIAAPQRLQILRVVYNQGPLNYVEIMNLLNLNPSRDAGKFAYHLRTLRQAKLVEVDKANKRYKLTSLGAKVITFSQDVEEHTLRESGSLLVRTSRLSMEEFDRNRIVQALSREAGVPIELGHKIAEETEERLLKLDTLYLTAPLIREFVNAVLIEKGFQEYRHKLTRLGLPVDDVTQLIKKAESSAIETVWIDRAMGKNVMTEYVLLEALPRKVADAHLSGQIHLNNIDKWVLKPDNIQHDLRVFLQTGYNPSQTTAMASTIRPPKTFEDALTLTLIVLNSSGIEVVTEQNISHFNLFLAPYTKNVPSNNLKEALERFVLILNQSVSNRTCADVSLGIDLSVPPSLTNVAIQGMGVSGTYGDYLDEALKISDILLDILIAEDTNKPLFQPHLVINLTLSNFTQKDVEPIVLKAHILAAKYGTPYFVNLVPEWQKDATYFSSGVRFAPDWTGDWELDTMRTGNLGTVVINLPRLAYGAKDSENKFLKDLSESIELAMTSLKIRQNMVQERINNALLPFLSQKIIDESYLRMKNTSIMIGFVGLNEAVKVMMQKQVFEDRQAADFAVKIIKYLTLEAKKLSWKLGLRVALSQSIDCESAQRLAELDVEKFGWGAVFTEGTRSSYYYTDTVTAPLEADISLKERLRIESSFHPLLPGGHLALLEMEEPNPEALLSLTREICQTYDLGAYAFTKSLGFCFNCGRTSPGFLQKCSTCKAVKAFVSYARLSSKYLPLDQWPLARKDMLKKRIRYHLPSKAE